MKNYVTMCNKISIRFYGVLFTLMVLCIAMPIHAQYIRDTIIVVENVKLSNQVFEGTEGAAIIVKNINAHKMVIPQSEFFNTIQSKINEAKDDVRYYNLLYDHLNKQRGDSMDFDAIHQKVDTNNYELLDAMKVSKYTFCAILEKGACSIFDKQSGQFTESITIELHIIHNAIFRKYFSDSHKLLLSHHIGSY